MQLELYHQELQQLALNPGQTPRCFAFLAITEQPLPMIITKGKCIEESICVQLMTGANVNFQSVSEIKAILQMDNSQPKSSSKSLEGETERMDDFSRSAKFNLKFLHGTRKNLATLKFNTQIQVSGGPRLALESNVSSHFVVITNECQFEESDGLLLKTDLFLQNPQVSWPTFANKLQRQFLLATRQDPLKPQRFLSCYELQYINTKFFDGGNVTAKNFDEFWSWFGKALQKLRYSRHMGQMWQIGLIYGFIERDEVNAALVNQEPGTFLIRLSERNPGTFAIGYVIEDSNPEKRVRHYLIKPEDLFGGKKSLPEFLVECPQFSKFLQVQFDWNSSNPRYRIIDKDSALEPFGVKKIIQDAPKNGYDGSLIGGSSLRS